jgi:hypothetical protein
MAYQKFRKNRCREVAHAIVADRFALRAGMLKHAPSLPWNTFVEEIGKHTVAMSGTSFWPEMSDREKAYIEKEATEFAKRLVATCEMGYGSPKNNDRH